MEQRRAVVVLVLLVIFFFSDTSTPPDHRARIAREHYRLDVLRNSTFGHPGNTTGLLSSPTPPRVLRATWRRMRKALLAQYLLPVPPLGAESLSNVTVAAGAHNRANDSDQGELRLSGSLPLYRNVTGNAFGDWTKLHFDWPLPATGADNTTGYAPNLTRLSGGKLVLGLEDASDAASQGQPVTRLKMMLRLKDADGKIEAVASLFGIHFTATGEMVAASTSDRFTGFHAVPHFTASEAQYNESKTVLVASIEKAVQTMEETRTLDAAPWISTDDPSPPKCEYIVYGQMHPVVGAALDGQRWPLRTLRAIESEMRFPTGASVPAAPALRLSALIYSPNCGVALVADRLEGKPLWQLYHQITRVALAAAALAAAMAWTLIRQMNESNTLSTVSRVSFWTITMMAVADGYCFFMFMIVGLLVGPACFLPLIAASFGYLMLAAVFEMRFLVTTYRVQRQSAPPAPAPAPPRPAPPAPSGGLLPLPVSAEPQLPVAPLPAAGSPTPTPAATAVTDEEVNSEISALHVKFYFAIVGIFFLTFYVASTWPPVSRDRLIQALLMLANSFWLPQVYRNAFRGSRKALQWEFVFGMSSLRLVPVLYVYLYPKNIFSVEPCPTAVMAIGGWLSLQCLMLLAQDAFGPRLLIPAHMLPAVYDYHSALVLADEADEEAGCAVAAGEDGGDRAFDCVVCMQPVEVPTTAVGRHAAAPGDGGLAPAPAPAVGLLGRRRRRAYMVTPCKHVFHTPCLEGWMRFRLQCPICRNPLPAL